MAMQNFQTFSGLLLLNLVFCCVKIAGISAIRWLLLKFPTYILSGYYSGEEKAGLAFLLWWLRSIMLFLRHPFLQLAMMPICAMMWKALMPLAERTWRVALTTAQILMMLVVAMVLCLAFRYVYQVQDSTSLQPALPFVALVILDIALFWRSGERATGYSVCLTRSQRNRSVFFRCHGP